MTLTRKLDLGVFIALMLTVCLASSRLNLGLPIPWIWVVSPLWLPLALCFLVAPFLWFVFACRWEFPNLRVWWCRVVHRRSHHLYWTDYCENHHKCHACGRLWLTGRKEGRYP